MITIPLWLFITMLVFLVVGGFCLGGCLWFFYTLGRDWNW